LMTGQPIDRPIKCASVRYTEASINQMCVG
jgi:hypothetical protein